MSHAGDTIACLSRGWVHEIAEFASFQRTKPDERKDFITREIDVGRAAYGRFTTVKPRRSVFVATTNRYDFADDPTGDRRYWPIHALRADVEWVVANRDQLWAEAVVRAQRGEKHWIEGTAGEALAAGLVEQYAPDRPHATTLSSILSLAPPNGWITMDALLSRIELKGAAKTPRLTQQIGQLLRSFGWTCSLCTPIGTLRLRCWHRKDADQNALVAF